MEIGKALGKASEMMASHFTEIMGATLTAVSIYGTKWYFGEYNIYTVIAPTVVSLLYLLYIENVKYGWVDK